MRTVQDVVIVSGVRTAIGGFGGSLKDVPPSQLGAMVIREAVKRAGVEPKDVQHVVMGQVIPTSPKDAYVARVCGVDAGIPVETPALTLNRLCGSGSQAIVSAAQMVQLGEADIVVAGGTESMSRSPYVSTTQRWGARMGDTTMIDALTTTLSDPWAGEHMGMTAERVAERYGISREEQDALALRSQKNAAAAIAEGRFAEQILPVELKTRKGVTVFDTDEHVRGNTTAETLAGMPTAFKKGGSVTAGNASGINDAAAAIVMMTAAEAERRKLRPMARIVSWGHAGVPPEIMGVGPVFAGPIALKRAGLTVADLDVIESNEAFAAQAAYVSRELGFPAEKVNPNGGAIALGHPIGATGAILTVKALYELERIKGRYGLITMCIGGGQGLATIIERLG